MGIIDDEEVKAFFHWIPIRLFTTSLKCDQLYHISDDIQNYGEYRVHGLRYSIKFGTLHSIQMFIK